MTAGAHAEAEHGKRCDVMQGEGVAEPQDGERHGDRLAHRLVTRHVTSRQALSCLVLSCLVLWCSGCRREGGALPCEAL
jgi:hypothetical protein